MSWNTICVGDVCKYTTSGGTPKTSVASYYEPPTVPWLKTKEVNYCRIYQTESYISQEGLDNSSAKLIPENSVIVAMYGQGDTAGRVAINKVPVSTNQACCNLVVDPEKADYEFVYYALSTLYEKLVSLKNGGAQPNLNAQIIRSVEIPFPPLETQHKIAAFLSAYDDLIENNQKQIKLLEEAAQRLYKEWFVDLRFPGHETIPITDGIPEGWKQGVLSDVIKESGRKISKDKREGYTYYLPIDCLPKKSLGYVDTNEIELAESSLVAFAPGDIIFGAMRPYFHKVVVARDNGITRTTCFVLNANDAIYWTYAVLLMFSVDTVDYATQISVGTTMPYTRWKDFKDMTVIIPSKECATTFDHMVRPIITKIGSLARQIILLQQARDRLLPKLMSGEIEV